MIPRIINAYRLLLFFACFFLVLFQICAMEKDIRKLNEELLSATNNNDAKTIKCLVDKGAEVNTFKNIVGVFYTPLMYAAYFGKEKSLKALLECKADTTLVDHGYRSALMNAASSGHIVCMKLLIEYKADPFYTNSREVSAFKMSLDHAENYNDCGKFLLDCALKADENIFFNKNNTDVFSALPESDYKKLSRQKIELFLMIKKHNVSLISLLPKPIILYILLNKDETFYYRQFNTLLKSLRSIKQRSKAAAIIKKYPYFSDKVDSKSCTIL